LLIFAEKYGFDRWQREDGFIQPLKELINVAIVAIGFRRKTGVCPRFSPVFTGFQYLDNVRLSSFFLSSR